MAALCEAEETAFEGISNPVFNFGGAETKVLKDFVEEIHTLCGGKGEIPIQYPRGKCGRSDQPDAVH